MDINMYVGRAGTGKSYACYERILQIMAENPGDPILLLVPDPATYKVERDLAEFMPQKGFTTVRVVGFNRLAYQIYQSTGKVEETGLSDLGKKLLLRLLMKRESANLELLNQVAKQPHFADIVQSLITECEMFRVEASDLKASSTKVQNMNLQRKLSELATIMDAYDNMVQTKFGERQNRFEELITLIPQSPIAQGAHVFVDGFHWFTPVQFELVKMLFSVAKESVITVTLPTDVEELAKCNRKGALFGRTKEVYDDVLKLQDQLGAKVNIVTFETNKRFATDSIALLESGFFTFPARNMMHAAAGMGIQKGEMVTQVPLTKAYNREREADAVCRKILELIEESGWRYKDITIMLRESETYGDTLEKTLVRYEIPFFTDRRHPMVTHPLSEFLTGLLAIVRNNFDHDTIFRVLKTDFFPFSRQAVDEMENYCLEFGIRDFKWLQNEWKYVRYNYKEDIENPDEERRLRVNATHNAIMQIFQPWWKFARTSHTGYEWCEQLYNIIQQLEIPIRLSEWSEEAERLGDTSQAASHKQMYKKVIAFFDDMMEVGKNEALTLDEMQVFLEEGLADVTYSLVPPSLDHVTVTTIERGYTRESDIVFVMGLNEGVFPQRMGDEGLLKDKEREELNGILKASNRSLAEGALVQSFNEQFLFYLACTRAKHALYLSFAGSDDEGAALEGSLAVNRLQQLGYCRTPTYVPLKREVGTDLDYMWRINQTMSLFATEMGELSKGGALGENMHSPWWSFYEWARTIGNCGDSLRYATRGVLAQNLMPIIDTDTVEKLFLHHHEMTGSVTRIEKYQACPFQFFAEYGLKLQPRRVKQVGAPEIGTFLHANLREMGERLLKENRQWRDLTDAEQKTLCRQISDELSEELFGLSDSFKVEDVINADMLSDADTTAFDEVAQLAIDGETVMLTNLRERLEATLERTVSRLRKWSSRTDFEQAYIEQRFGHGAYAPWNPIHIHLDDTNGSSIRLEGQIDRVDLWKDDSGNMYGMIVDYKSGGAYVSASDIYYGLKLQLITYLLALEKNKEKILGKGSKNNIYPAATVYMQVKNPQRRISELIHLSDLEGLRLDNSDIKNSGYFLHDVDMLRRIDYEAGTTSTEFLPVRLNKEFSAIHGGDKSKVKQLDEFRILTQYAERIIQKAGQQVLKGHFPISPYNKDGINPCSYCDYRTVCRFERAHGSNTYRYIDKLSEAEGIEKMTIALKDEEGGEVYAVDDRTTKRD